MAKKTGIIWLASYPKSGNTWTRSFLNNLTMVQKHGLNAEAQGINEMNALTSWDIAGRLYRDLTGRMPKELGFAETAKWRGRVQAKIADESPDAMLVKTHNALVMDHGYPTINMGVTSGVVYIVRNPLDVAISFAHHLACTIDQAIAVMNRPGYRAPATDQSAHEIYGSWSENVLSWTGKPNPALTVMRYEDMHANPGKAFGALARHLGMGANKRQIARAIELSSFKNLQSQEREKGYRE